MAQRAYRQRKESTLEELRQRVSNLTNTIELMNKNFGDCRDRLYSYNLPQGAMLDVHSVSSQFDSLVKEARNPHEDSKSGVCLQACDYTSTPWEARASHSSLIRWNSNLRLVAGFGRTIVLT